MWSVIIIDNCMQYFAFAIFSSGPARIGKRGNFSYDEWLGRKKSAEQKIISVRKAEEEKKRLEEDERYVIICLPFTAFVILTSVEWYEVPNFKQ